MHVKYASENNQPSANLHMSNIPSAIDQAMLTELLMASGCTVVRSRIIPDACGTGFNEAMVELGSQSEATATIQAFNGQPLQPGELFSRVNAADEPGSERVELEVQLVSGAAAATVVANTNDSVALVKEKIARVEGTPVWQQKLVLGSHTLSKDAALLGSRGPFEDGRAVVTLIRLSTFIPTPTYEEPRPGYVFKLGEHGLGYYIDEYEQRKLDALPTSSIHSVPYEV